MYVDIYLVEAEIIHKWTHFKGFVYVPHPYTSCSVAWSVVHAIGLSYLCAYFQRMNGAEP